MTVNTALSTLSGIDFASRQGYAVARLALDQARSQGEAANELIRAAESLGKSVPARSDPTGPVGRTLDTYA